MPRRWLAALVFLVVFVAAPVPEALALPALPLPLTPDQLNEEPYHSVGLVRTDSFGPDPSVLGSGWVVDEHVVASAAHVFFVEQGLGWSRNRWYWKQAAATDQYWDTSVMIQPRTYRVLAGYADAIAREAYHPEYFMDARNRDAVALMFYQKAADSPPPPRALNSLGGSGTYTIVGYPVVLAGVPVTYIEMRAHIGGHAATFTLSDEVTDWGGWQNSMYGSVDISSGPGGSGGPVFKLIDGQWKVVGSLLAGITDVEGFCRSIDDELEGMFQGAIADSTVAGPGLTSWELAIGGNSNPVIRGDGSIVSAKDYDSVTAIDSSGVELWSQASITTDVKWLAEAPDGRILAGGLSGLAALDGSTGSILWHYPAGGSYGRGAVGESGETYVCGDLHLWRISPDGALDWTIALPNEGLNQSEISAPAVGQDGTVYVVSQDHLYAFNPADGSLIWKSDRIVEALGATLSIGLDGSITVARTGGIVRFEPDGSTRWSFENSSINSPQVYLRPDGTTVIVSYNLIILNPDGTQQSTIQINGGANWAVEDSSGHVYVSTDNGTLGLDSSGTQLWINQSLGGKLYLGASNFLLSVGGPLYSPGGLHAAGSYSGVDRGTWEAGVGGANGARRVSNSLPRAAHIAASPASTNVFAGYRLELSVKAEGTLPMSFEWRKDGVLLPEQIGRKLIIPNASETDAGEYVVTVRNAAGEETSAAATVTVNTPQFGDQVWATNMTCESAPAIDDDGTTYAEVREVIPGTQNVTRFFAVAIDAAGNERWRRQLAVDVSTSGGSRSPVVGDDGRIYFGTPGHIVALSKTGALLWESDLPVTVGNDWPLIVLARDDGIFYRTDSYLGSFTPDGERRWERSDINAVGMQVRRDGNLVVGVGKVVSPEGILNDLNSSSASPGKFGFLGPDDEWVVTTTYDGGVTLDKNGQVIARNPDSLYDQPLFMLGDGSIVTDRPRLEPFLGNGYSDLSTPGNGKIIGVLEGDRMLWSYGDGGIAVFDRTGTIIAQKSGSNWGEFTISRSGVLVGGHLLAARKLDWGVSSSPWPLPRADSRMTNRSPVDFMLNPAAPQSVSIRGRLDPFQPQYGSLPYQDSTMQAYAGYGASLIAAVYGSGPFTYQWTKNGNTIEGVDGGELRFDSPKVSDSGDYTVSVTNNGGTTASESFTLTVSPPVAVTPGTYVRMWTDPNSAQTWPCVYKVSSDRVLEINIFNEYGMQGRMKVFPDGSFSTFENPFTFSGSLVGSTLTLSGSAPLADPPVAVTGTTSNGLPAGVYRGHALGPTGFPVTAVVFADGSFSWLQTGLNGYSTSARSSFAGTSRSTALEVVSSGGSLDYTVKADPSGALVGSLSSSATAVTGFAAVWLGRPQVERFANLSTRGYVTPTQPPMIVGFVVNGTTNDSFLVRGVGPALADFGVPGTLARPRLRLMNSKGVQLQQSLAWASAANWTDVQDTAARVGAFPLAEGSADAALEDSQPPGPYTALIDGADGGSGIALVEVYEDPTTSGGGSRLLNLSTRGLVSNGNRVLIGGFVITGSVPKSVLVRAVGPSLAPYAQGLFNVASDPRIRIYAGGDSVNPIASNDDYWLGGNEPEVRAAAQQVGAFELAQGSKDAALVIALKPGLYSAVVDNMDSSDGVALLEIYEIPAR